MNGNTAGIIVVLILVWPVVLAPLVSIGCSQNLPEIPESEKTKTLRDHRRTRSSTRRDTDHRGGNSSMRESYSGSSPVSVRHTGQSPSEEDRSSNNPETMELPKNGSVELSLDEAVRIALGGNSDIQIASVPPKIARARTVDALGQFDPSLYVDQTLQRSQEPTASQLSGAANLRNQSHRQEAGLRGTLPTGTRYDLSTSFERTESNSVFRTVDPQYEAQAGLTVTQPLLKGGGTEATLSEYRAADRALEGRIADYRAAINRNILRVQLAYWDRVSAIQQLEVAETGVELAEETVRVNQAKLDANRIPKVDLLQSQTRKSSAQEELFIAENRAKNKNEQLLILLSPPGVNPEAWNTNLNVTAEPSVSDQKYEMDRQIDVALSRRPQMKSLKKQIQEQKQRIVNARNRTLPNLDLQARYGYNGLRGDSGDAIDQLDSGDFPEWLVGLNFSYPIGNRSASSELREARLKKRKLQLEKRKLKSRITLQVREALRFIRTARSQVRAAKQSKELAREQLDAETTRQQAGLSTTFQVLELQEKFLNARERLIQARVKAAKSRTRLNHATGKFVDRYLK